MSNQAETHFKRPASLLMLWTGVAAGPVSWALSQQLTYLLATFGCSYGFDILLSPVMVITLVLAAAGIMLSWGNYRRAGGQPSVEGGDPASRSRFLALGGLMLSSFSALAIVAEWLPVFFSRDCQR